MDRKFHLIKPRELAVIGAVLAAAAAAVFIPKLIGGDGAEAVIRCGDETHTVSLSTDREFTLEICGDTVFEISDGRIRIKNALCPDKHCEKTGFISSPSESIICVPEKIIITINSSSSDEDKTDASVG